MNLAALEREQQRRFLEWMDQGDRHVQIISTSGRYVWSRVERGAFLKPLYYRLGVVYVDFQRHIRRRLSSQTQAYVDVYRLSTGMCVLVV